MEVMAIIGALAMLVGIVIIAPFINFAEGCNIADKHDYKGLPSVLAYVVIGYCQTHTKEVILAYVCHDS